MSSDNIPFSQELENWVNGKGPKTFLSLDRVFAEKSFALIFILLLAPSALPVPTGGITTVFEAMAILIAAQMLVGRRSLWLPKRWRGLTVNKFMRTHMLPKLIGLIRWFERYSRPRASYMLDSAVGIRLFGLTVIIFSLAALVSPPFSGLDTLPSLAVVVVSLAVMLEDFLLYLFGLLVGTAGITLMLVIGKAAFELFTRFF